VRVLLNFGKNRSKVTSYFGIKPLYVVYLFYNFQSLLRNYFYNCGDCVSKSFHTELG
jgi:hypothetical protein